MKTRTLTIIVMFLMYIPLAIAVAYSPVVAKDLREMIPAQHMANGGGWTWYGSHGSLLSTLVYGGLSYLTGIPAQNIVMFLLPAFAIGIFYMLYTIAFWVYDDRLTATIAVASFTLFPAYARLADMRPSILGIFFIYLAVHTMMRYKRIPWFWGLVTLLWSPMSFFFLMMWAGGILLVEHSYPHARGFYRFMGGSLLPLLLLLLGDVILSHMNLGGMVGKYVWSVGKDIYWIYIPMVAPLLIAGSYNGFKRFFNSKWLALVFLLFMCVPLHPWLYTHVWENGLTAPDEATVRLNGFPGEPGFSIYSFPVHAYYIVNRFDYHSPVGKMCPGVQFDDGMPELLDWFSQQPVESRYVSLCMYYNNFSVTFPNICENQDPVTLFEFIPKYSGVLPAVDVPLGDIIMMYVSPYDRQRLLKNNNVDYLLLTDNERMLYGFTSFCAPVFESGTYAVYSDCFRGFEDYPYQKMANLTTAINDAIEYGRYCIMDPVEGCV